MVSTRRRAQIVAQPVEIGPLFAGNTAPQIQFILTYDTGGYVDLTGATVRAGYRRYDRVRSQNVGVKVASALCTIQVATRGECVFTWADAQTGLQTVPPDPGYYAFRVEVIFPGGEVQQSQDAVFEVLPAVDVTA